MTTAGSAPQAAESALREPNFILFWLAQAVSRFGDPITLIGLVAVTYQLTGSALYTSVAVLVATLPQATFGFFAGAIADGLGHRRAMIAADVVRAVVIGCIPPLLAAGVPLAVSYLLVFVAGICTAVFNPARVSIVPLLLKREQLVSGNATIYATDRVVEILGAVCAGLLVAAIGTAVFYVDAATFALSAALMAVVRASGHAARPITWERTKQDAAAGLRVLGESAVLRANTIFSLVAQLSLPVLNSLLPVLVFRRFAAGAPDLGATLFGLAEAAIAAGAVFGSLVLTRVFRATAKGALVVWGFAACGVSLIAAALAPSFELLLLALIVTGVTNVIFYVPNIGILQQLAPADVRGAVVGARISLLSLTWLPIVVAGGALAEAVDVSALIAIAGAFTVVVALTGSRMPVLTDVR